MYSVVVTGGTGTIGRALIPRLLADGASRVVSVSRDEVKAEDLAQDFKHPNLRVFLGDVRDTDRLVQAFAGCDTVIHAAALKKVTESAYSPSEVIKTNVQGTINVIQAAHRVGAKRVLFLSSDKAVHATNLYGATKFTAECYAVQSNSYTYPSGLKVACTRYGNVLGSRGSVTEIWKAVPESDPLPLTSARMTRLLITQQMAVEFILAALRDMRGGEIFVPVLPAASILDLAISLYPGRDTRMIGLRPGGEKTGELLVSDEELYRLAWAGGDRAVVLPSFRTWSTDEYGYGPGVQPGERDMFSSSATDYRLSVEEIRDLCTRS